MDRDAGTRIRVSLRAEPEPTPEREEIPRIVRLLALAHRWHRQLDEGVYGAQAEIARMTGLTRARVTQIMDLSWLSPLHQIQLAHGTRAWTSQIEMDWKKQVKLSPLDTWDRDQLHVSEGGDPRLRTTTDC